MRTDTLSGPLLDYWVGRGEKLYGVGIHPESGVCNYFVPDHELGFGISKNFSPVTDYEDSGPIIEREAIGAFPPSALSQNVNGEWVSSEIWTAYKKNSMQWQPSYGETSLIAAMRCYVVSKFGADVPEIISRKPRKSNRAR